MFNDFSCKNCTSCMIGLFFKIKSVKTYPCDLFDSIRRLVVKVLCIKPLNSSKRRYYFIYF